MTLYRIQLPFSGALGTHSHNSEAAQAGLVAHVRQLDTLRLTFRVPWRGVHAKVDWGRIGLQTLRIKHEGPAPFHSTSQSRQPVSQPLCCPIVLSSKFQQTSIALFQLVPVKELMNEWNKNKGDKYMTYAYMCLCIHGSHEQVPLKVTPVQGILQKDSQCMMQERVY